MGALTQRELAERVGTSQSAIASLERGDANPTVETLARCAEAAGFSLHVRLEPLPVADAVVERYKRDVDRTVLRENLRTSVDERLRTCQRGSTPVANCSVRRHSPAARSNHRRGARDEAPPMTELEQLLAALSDAGVEFIIVGGVAARAHGSSRLTDDIDEIGRAHV